ncbi:hypothetical protein [Hyphomonas sp.]|uniref:hypothetical protein n=1 Tax=Hyphomonas sp. TaxID=87 RepID=UPI00391A3D87
MITGLKMRAGLLIGGTISGLAGTGLLAYAAASALSPWLGTAGAAAAVGLTLAGAAGITAWMALKPAVPVDDEMAGLRESLLSALAQTRDDTIDSLAQLPAEAVNRLLDEQPIPTLIGVAVAAYTVARSPVTAAAMIDRLVARAG